MKKWYWILAFGLALALGLAVGANMEKAYAEPTPGTRIQLPILNHIGDVSGGVETWIEVQNVGAAYTKAVLVLWGEAGQCAPQANGPIKVECTGLLKPGTTWNFRGSKVPAGAKSGIVYSVAEGVADAFCSSFFGATGSEGAWKGVEAAWVAGGVGQPLAVEVWRKGPGDDTPAVSVTASYSGISEAMEGMSDPVYGGYAYYAPLVYAEHPDPPKDFTSWIYIQNSGDECTSVEIWFQKQDDCLRDTICEIDYLAPGETYQYDASMCVGPSFVGSAWIRSSQPLGIVVDQVGRDILMAYDGKPANLQYEYGEDPYFTVGSLVAYGPLIYREYQGWETLVQVQNLSSITSAKVKVYFMDASGDIINTLVDWICPRGSQSYSLPVINDLPGHYVGAIRVESQEWWTSGDPKVQPPYIVGIAELLKYEGPVKAEVLEAIAYNLFAEDQAYDWQEGTIAGYSPRVIGVPSILKSASGLTTELAIQNVTPKPGYTDFAIYLFDQNGLLDYVCEKLNEKQVEYINFNDWGYINPGFKGSAVILQWTWNYPGTVTGFTPGMAVVKVERSGTVLSSDIPGDESAGSEGFPVGSWLEFGWEGPEWPACPPDVCGNATVRGFVTDDASPPAAVEGALVYLAGYPGASGIPGLVDFTDKNGEFVITNVPTNYGYYVLVSADGHCDGVFAVLAPCDADLVEAGSLVIFRDASISGIMWDDVDGDGMLSAGDSVHQGETVDLYTAADVFKATAATNANGEYAFNAVCPSDAGYKVCFVDPQGDGTFCVEIDLDPTDAYKIDFDARNNKVYDRGMPQ